MPYSVTLEGKEKTFQVGDDESLLSAALAQSIALPYGCQSGGCGACRARVLEGEVRYDYDPPALNPHEKAQGYALLCQARAASDLRIQVHELPDHHAIQVQNIPVRVQKQEMLCHDVLALWLKLPKGEVLEYLAGQYLDILLRDGRRRSFSIANAWENYRDTGLIELHLRHVPGGRFTDYAFSDMPERAMLRVEVPLGNFYLREESERPLLFVAGGTGLAPIKAMLEHLLISGSGRKVYCYWGVRARQDLYFHEELMDLKDKMPTLRYTPVLSEPQQQDDWRGETGWVHEIAARDMQQLAEMDVYISGPPALISAAASRFSAMGLEEDHFFADAFDYAHETWPDREKQ